MKWLKFLKAARKRTLEAGVEAGANDESGNPQKHSKRRSMQQERKERTSIEQWHEARKSRTSIDICAAFNVTTTERLSVCKAGITLLINRTYIVIKHLGSGSSGQVKLAFNLRSKKLVAIKAVRKGSAGAHPGGGCHGHGMPGLRDARSYDGRGSHGGGVGGGGGGHPHGGGSLSASQSVSALPSGGRSSAGSSSRGWRVIAPSSFLLRRSASSNIGSSTSTRGASPAAASPSPSPSPLRRCPGGGVAAAARGGGNAEEFVREIAILKRLSHPNIVQLVEVIDDPASDCLLLVMGYVEGATLQPQQLQPGRWRPVPEEVVWRYARDVLCGLEYLHCHGVVHGDLKPANFIQDSLTGVVRILDFGSAVLHGRVVGEDGLRGAHVPMSCTPGFRSPESLAAGYRPSFELDMWALGVCLYLWVFGELPFKGSAPFVVYDNIRSASLVIPSHTRISPQLHDVLIRLLDKDPFSRMTVHETVLHPWITAQGLAPLRTPSPLVMAARVQLATAAAEADMAATTATTTQCNPSSTLACRSQLLAQHRERDRGQQPPVRQLSSSHSMQTDGGGCLEGGAVSAGGPSAGGIAAAGSSLTPGFGSSASQLPSQPAAAASTVTSTRQLLSCSSSSVNLLNPAADAAAAADLLSDDASRRDRSAAPLAPAPPLAPPSATMQDVPMEPWTAAAAPPPPLAEEGPWRMSAGPSTASTGPSPSRSSTGMAAFPTANSHPPGFGAMAGALPHPGWVMPRIAEGSSTGYGGPLVAAAAAVMAGGGSSTGGRRKSSEAWELRRTVTDEELQAAISSVCDVTGSAAELMESIFAEVTFPAKHQIIRAGDPLERIYLITSGEVEIYHDLVQDGPDAPCPHKPIIEGLSDPESELDDPGDFLNIRLPGSTVPELERLSTGLLNMTAGGDRSNHGASHAAAALAAAFGGPPTGPGTSGAPSPSPGPSAPASANGYTPAGPTVQPSPNVAVGARGRATLTGLMGAGSGAAGCGKGSNGREPSGGSIGLFSRAATQTGHLIVAVKGPGDSLGFAGMLPGAGGGSAGGASAQQDGGGGAAAAARQPVWSANVRARTQVTAFVASIESLHKLARMHPQVEPLLQQMAVQQETDLAVAEAMRALRLVGGAATRGAAAAAAAATATAAASVAGAAAGTAAAPAGAAAAASATATVAVPPLRARAGAAAAGASGHGTAGGVSSEGESESWATAATMNNALLPVLAPAVLSGMPLALASSVSSTPQALMSSLSEWRGRSGGGGGAVDAERAAGVTRAGAAGPYDMVESNEDVNGVDEGDVMMLSGEIP